MKYHRPDYDRAVNIHFHQSLLCYLHSAVLITEFIFPSTCCSGNAGEFYSTNAFFFNFGRFIRCSATYLQFYSVLPGKCWEKVSFRHGLFLPNPSQFISHHSSYLQTPYILNRITDDFIKEPQKPQVQGYYALQAAVQFVQPCGIRTWGAQCKTAAEDSTTYDTHLQTGR